MPHEISGTGTKYAGIDRPGKVALREGSIKEFKGFDKLDNRFNISLLFDPGSEIRFDVKVAEPLALLAEELDIGLFLAGRDFTLHATVLEGLYEGEGDSDRLEKFAEVHKSNAVTTVDEMVGEKLEFKYLLVGGNNIILTAITIPDWVTEKRADLAEAYKEQGLKPLDMTNILHISVARMTRKPSENSNKKLETFAQKVARLRHQVSSHPLTLNVGEVNVGSPYNLVPREL